MPSILAILFFLTLSAFSQDTPHQITWEDLLPKEEAPIDDPFAKLSEEQLSNLGMVARIRYLLESEKIAADGPDVAEEKRLVSELTEQGIDVDWILSQRERVAEDRQKRAEKVDTGIDGERIRIPGYLLPLKRAHEGVTEALLVPWVGACIHTPPPPPNQMVHLGIPGGTEDRGGFAAIWIEGVIRLEPGIYDLFLVDGTRSINVAYTMTPDAVTEYSAAESDTLARVEIPEEALEGHSLWQRWQTKVSLLFTKTMTDIRDRKSSGPLLFGLLVAFLYGVVHTLGPGHGKAVVISYFVGEGGTVARGVAMGFRIAVFHVLSAIVVVVLTDFAVRQATGSAPSDYRVVRLISYAGIAAIGTWMLVAALNRARLKHTHNETGVPPVDPDGTGETPVSHSHAHAHDHSHDCLACAALEKETKGAGGWLSVAIGAVPCTGALLVLLFGLANDLLWPSVVMVIAISLGMALALSGVGIAAILGRRFVDSRMEGDEARQHRFTNGARIAGAALVLCIGLGLFALAW